MGKNKSSKQKEKKKGTISKNENDDVEKYRLFLAVEDMVKLIWSPKEKKELLSRMFKVLEKVHLDDLDKVVQKYYRFVKNLTLIEKHLTVNIARTMLIIEELFSNDSIHLMHLVLAETVIAQNFILIISDNDIFNTELKVVKNDFLDYHYALNLENILFPEHNINQEYLTEVEMLKRFCVKVPNFDFPKVCLKSEENINSKPIEINDVVKKTKSNSKKLKNKNESTLKTNIIKENINEQNIKDENDYQKITNNFESNKYKLKNEQISEDEFNQQWLIDNLIEIKRNIDFEKSEELNRMLSKNSSSIKVKELEEYTVSQSKLDIVNEIGKDVAICQNKEEAKVKTVCFDNINDIIESIFDNTNRTSEDNEEKDVSSKLDIELCNQKFSQTKTENVENITNDQIAVSEKIETNNAINDFNQTETDKAFYFSQFSAEDPKVSEFSNGEYEEQLHNGEENSCMNNNISQQINDKSSFISLSLGIGIKSTKCAYYRTVINPHKYYITSSNTSHTGNDIDYQKDSKVNEQDEQIIKVEKISFNELNQKTWKEVKEKFNLSEPGSEYCKYVTFVKSNHSKADDNFYDSLEKPILTSFYPKNTINFIENNIDELMKVTAYWEFCQEDNLLTARGRKIAKDLFSDPEYIDVGMDALYSRSSVSKDVYTYVARYSSLKIGDYLDRKTKKVEINWCFYAVRLIGTLRVIIQQVVIREILHSIGFETLSPKNIFKDSMKDLKKESTGLDVETIEIFDEGLVVKNRIKWQNGNFIHIEEI